MSAFEVLGSLLTLLLPVLQYWLATKPARDKEKRDEEVRQGREAIATGNADAVTVRIDSLPQTSNSAPVLGDTEDTKRRLKVLGIE